LNEPFSGVAPHDAVSVGYFPADPDLGPKMLFACVKPLLEAVKELAEAEQTGVLPALAAFFKEPLQGGLV
jgi:hypothetical protein